MSKKNQHSNGTRLGLASLLVLGFAAQAGAVPITTFNSAFQFRWYIGPNSVDLPEGDRQFVGVINVAPTAGTTVTATQGAVTRPLPFTSSSIFPTMFRALEPFDPASTGVWTITAMNGGNAAGPLLAPAIANPQILPFVEDLEVVGTGTTPTVTWTLPDLTGVDFELLRFRAYNDLNNEIIVNTVVPGGLTGTSFAIPANLLFPSVPYIFSISVEDGEPSTSTENVSTAFTQSAYLIPDPPEALVDLLVASRANGRVIRYDDMTRLPIGNFVLPTRDGLESPTGITYGPDGNLYVANGLKADGTAPLENNVLRYDGLTGEFIDEFSSGYPTPITQIVFGPDGDLYVSASSGNVVYRTDGTTGEILETFAGPGSPLNFAAGLTFGPDGNLYVGSFLGNQVVRFDGTTGDYIDTFATVPIAGSAGNVGGVAFGPDGDLYVTLVNTGDDIWRFDGTTGESKGSFIAPGSLHPDGPFVLLFAPNDTLYVSSRDADQVLSYDAITGEFIEIVATGGGLDNATGIALPEPGATTQLGAGLIGLVALARRRHRGATGRVAPRA